MFGLMTEACFAKLSAFVLGSVTDTRSAVRVLTIAFRADAACLKAVVSKLLGYAVIAGAVVR